VHGHASRRVAGSKASRHALAGARRRHGDLVEDHQGLEALGPDAHRDGLTATPAYDRDADEFRRCLARSAEYAGSIGMPARAAASPTALECPSGRRR
jgi:hypothetical protein